MAHRLMGVDGGWGWTAVCRNASLEERREEAIFMAVHRRPAAAAQVSVCAVMTVIVRKESSL